MGERDYKVYCKCGVCIKTVRSNLDGSSKVGEKRPI